MLDGNEIPSEVYFPLKWAVIKALAYADQLLSLSFVRKIEVQDGTDERNTENHTGWNGAIDIIIHMWYSRTTLKT